MTEIKRHLINICSRDLETSRDFYMTHFSFSIGFESDWFILLRSDKSHLELGIIKQDHKIVPEGLNSQPSTGLYLTFIIEDIDAFYEKAKDSKCVIVSAPENLFYGQRRCVIRDPDGHFIDVSAVIRN